MLITAYSISNKGQLLPFYFIDEISTEKYTTTKTDRKKNISKIPTSSPTVNKYFYYFNHFFGLEIGLKIKLLLMKSIVDEFRIIQSYFRLY